MSGNWTDCRRRAQCALSLVSWRSCPCRLHKDLQCRPIPLWKQTHAAFMDGVPPANLLGGWKSGHIVAATPFCPGQGWTYSVFPELRRAELAPSGSHAINCENIWDSRGVKEERKRRRRIEDWG